MNTCTAVSTPAPHFWTVNVYGVWVCGRCGEHYNGGFR